MSMKHHRRTSRKIAEDDAKLIAHLDAGGSPKVFAFDAGLGLQAVYQRARALGYRIAYVRDAALGLYKKTDT